MTIRQDREIIVTTQIRLPDSFFPLIQLLTNVLELSFLDLAGGIVSRLLLRTEYSTCNSLKVFGLLQPCLRMIMINDGISFIYPLFTLAEKIDGQKSLLTLFGYDIEKLNYLLLYTNRTIAFRQAQAMAEKTGLANFAETIENYKTLFDYAIKCKNIGVTHVVVDHEIILESAGKIYSIDCFITQLRR